MKSAFIFVTIFSLLFTKNYVCAQVSSNFNNETKTLSPFTNIFKNTTECFTGKNILFHTTAVVSTYLLIYSNIDFHVHDYFAKNEDFSFLSDPSAWVGYFAPVVLCGGIYLWGKSKNNNELLTAASAVAQSTIIALAYSSLLKAFTGRPNPDPSNFTDMKLASQIFQFGFLNGGIHYGWPSGHLATNTAAVISLIYFYKDSTILKIIGGTYIGYLLFGVSSHEGATMHWFSDVVAGTLIGFVIGNTIGNNFRKLFNNEKISDTNNNFQVIPISSPDFKCMNIRIPL